MGDAFELGNKLGQELDKLSLENEKAKFLLERKIMEKMMLIVENNVIDGRGLNELEILSKILTPISADLSMSTDE